MRFKPLTQASLVAVGLLSLSALPAKALNCSAGDVTAFGLGSSSSCIGAFTGNDAQGDGSGALFDQLSTGVFNNITNWEFVGKSDEGAFDVSSGNTGTWSIETALTGPFVLSLKAGNAWSAYFFEGSSDPFAVLGGTWNTNGVSVNGNRNARDISHATIYRAANNTPPDTSPVPEPSAALGLFAVGALGFLKQKRA